MRDISRGADIVVGTPGRIMDLQARGALDLSAVGLKGPVGAGIVGLCTFDNRQPYWACIVVWCNISTHWPYCACFVHFQHLWTMLDKSL